jgi:hypothetical protein
MPGWRRLNCSLSTPGCGLNQEQNGRRGCVVRGILRRVDNDWPVVPIRHADAGRHSRLSTPNQRRGWCAAAHHDAVDSHSLPRTPGRINEGPSTGSLVSAPSLIPMGVPPALPGQAFAGVVPGCPSTKLRIANRQSTRIWSYIDGRSWQAFRCRWINASANRAAIKRGSRSSARWKHDAASASLPLARNALPRSP